MAENLCLDFVAMPIISSLLKGLLGMLYVEMVSERLLHCRQTGELDAQRLCGEHRNQCPFIK